MLDTQAQQLSILPPIWSSLAMEMTKLAAMVKKSGRVCRYASRHCTLFVES